MKPRKPEFSIFYTDKSTFYISIVKRIVSHSFITGHGTVDDVLFIMWLKVFI